jgi:DNA repair protein RadD
MHTIRDYQKESIDRVRQSMRTNNRVILQLPTGAGKTFIASEIIHSAVAKGKTVSFVADRLNLIDQTSQSFYNFGIEHGIIQGDHWMTDYSKQVQVCSIQTLARRKFRHHSDLVIIDEAHTMYAKQLEMLDKWNSKFIGLTATPYSKGMGLHWDDLIVGATTKQLIDAGYLSDFEVYAPPPPDLSGVKTSRGDYVVTQLAERVNQSSPIGDVVSTWQRYGNNNQTICFAVNIEHSQHLVKRFNEAGVKAAHIDAYTDSAETRQVLEAYRQGAIKLVSCVDILTKGADFPMTGTLIMARPTKSLIVHIQQIGRALRIAPDKENAIILDHGANVERHGFPTDTVFPARLDTTPPKERMKDTTKERLPKACPSCSFVRPVGVHICPKCGFEPKRFNNTEHEAGELVKVKSVGRAVKQAFFSEMLGYAKLKGYSQGFAAHQYRDKFKEWPDGLERKVAEPSHIAKNWIKHQAIRRKYGRKSS